MQIMNMTGYVLFWYFLGVKLTWGHAHKTRSWYLLGVTLKKSYEHPRHLYMGVPPTGFVFLLADPISDVVKPEVVCIFMLAGTKII